MYTVRLTDTHTHTLTGRVLTVTLHPLVDESIQQRATVVTEGGTTVRVDLELVLASRILGDKERQGELTNTIMDLMESFRYDTVVRLVTCGEEGGVQAFNLFLTTAIYLSLNFSGWVSAVRFAYHAYCKTFSPHHQYEKKKDKKERQKERNIQMERKCQAVISAWESVRHKHTPYIRRCQEQCNWATVYLGLSIWSWGWVKTQLMRNWGLMLW